jgi:hypothetical protein
VECASTLFVPLALFTFHLDNGVCQLSAGHAAREASRSVPVCYVGDQFQTELPSVQDALKHLHHPEATCVLIPLPSSKHELLLYV